MTNDQDLTKSRMNIEVRVEDVRAIFEHIRTITKTRAEGVGLLMAVYFGICEAYEPSMSREQAAEYAKHAILSAQWGKRATDSTH